MNAHAMFKKFTGVSLLNRLVSLERYYDLHEHVYNYPYFVELTFM